MVLNVLLSFCVRNHMRLRFISLHSTGCQIAIVIIIFYNAYITDIKYTILFVS